MQTPTDSFRENVRIELPVKVDYKVLNDFLQKKFEGKILSKDKGHGKTTDHALIQKISLGRSPLEDYDLAVHAELQLRTTLFKGKAIKIVVHLSLGFRESEQEVLIRKYKLEGQKNGWFTDRVVETLINNFMYVKLKEKMKFDIRPIIADKMEKLNVRLTGGLEITDGVNITGKVTDFRVQEVIPGQRTLLVSVSILGNNVLNINNIEI